MSYNSVGKIRKNLLRTWLYSYIVLMNNSFCIGCYCSSVVFFYYVFGVFFKVFIPPVHLVVYHALLFIVQLLSTDFRFFADFIGGVLECRDTPFDWKIRPWDFRWLPNRLSCCIAKLLRISVCRVLNCAVVLKLSIEFQLKGVQLSSRVYTRLHRLQ